MIRIYGLNNVQRKLARKMVEMCLNKFTPRMKKRMLVKVKGVDSLINRENIYGDCDILDHENRRPKQFIIRIDSCLKMEMMLKTLAHEMVHVKQYARGELKSGHDLAYSADYFECPNEIEAHGREEGLYRQFLEMHPRLRNYAEENVTDYKMFRSSQMVFEFDW